MMARQIIFQAANVVIALDYLLIGIFLFGRARAGMRVRATNPKAAAGLVAMVIFFFGCVHTHAELMLLGDAVDDRWFEWHTVISHVVQALGGFVFWYLARRHLVINIFDRVTYDKATRASSAAADTEARLDFLAMKVGLLR